MRPLPHAGADQGGEQPHAIRPPYKIHAAAVAKQAEILLDHGMPLALEILAPAPRHHLDTEGGGGALDPGAQRRRQSGHRLLPGAARRSGAVTARRRIGPHAQSLNR